MFRKEHIPYRDLALLMLVIVIVYWFYPINWILCSIPIIALVGSISKPFREINHQIWVKITLAFSKIFPPIFLTLIFFFIVVPIGTISRIFKKSKDDDAATNFQLIDEEEIDISFFERVW